MEQPYYNLDLDFEVKDTWRDVVDPIKPKSVYLDSGCKYLSESTLAFFDCAGIICDYGYIWTWPSIDYWPEELRPIENQPYHTDFPDGRAQVAINYILAGDPGATEWIDILRAKKYGIIDRPKYGYQVTSYQSDECDVRTSIKYGMPMLTRINVPHRVRAEGIVNTRITYSLRMYDKKLKKELTWSDAVKYLQPFIDS